MLLYFPKTIFQVSKAEDVCRQHIVSKKDLSFLLRVLGESTDKRRQSLYGKAYQHAVNSKVDGIVEMILGFVRKESRSSSKQEIEGAIKKLCATDALDCENQVYLEMGRQMLDGQESKGGKKAVDILPFYEERFNVWKEAELPYALFEFAKCFYENKSDEALLGIIQKTLSNEQSQYLNLLKKKAVAAITGGKKREMSTEEDRLTWVQALIGMGDDIALGMQKHRLPSFEEIETVFADLSAINS